MARRIQKTRAKPPLTYKAAGVNIDAGQELVERIKGAVARTRRVEVLGDLGGFGGLFKVPGDRYKRPILVAGTDGVGTKIELAGQYDAHECIGIDLVAMCVNDVIVVGAEPLFFLDYLVTPRLDVDIAARVVSGIAKGCELAGAALIGGETAEHPGMHMSVGYDLAGFCVGVVEEPQIIDGQGIKPGDTIIGLGSSGTHSNGFSLIRRVLEHTQADETTLIDGRPLIEQLLTPTRIYADTILNLIREVPVKGIAHITGGGLTENIPRVLPKRLGASLRASEWPSQPVFDWLRDAGVAEAEMLRTFNCGIGMCIVVSPSDVEEALALLRNCGEDAWAIGRVVRDRYEKVRVS